MSTRKKRQSRSPSPERHKKHRFSSQTSSKSYLQRDNHQEPSQSGVDDRRSNQRLINKISDSSDAKSSREAHTRNLLPFPFEEHRSVIDRLFFSDFNVIVKGSTAYDEFWKFYGKYQIMQKQQGATNWIPANIEKVTEIGVPSTFHRSFLLNMSLNLPSPEKLMSRMSSEEEHKTKITKERIMEFQLIIQLYLEFLQREKLAKLKKLRESQSKLPIAQYKDTIVKTVKENQITIIAGDTGCGKSTQVPQYLLHNGFSRIVCTQPRRIACISLSKRVSFETLNEFGSQVGYQIRFEKTKTQNTRICFVTEGLLLRQISVDPTLHDYEIVVLDEVHERHLAGDFLLGTVNCLIQSRPDLKLILMSATINIALFQNYFQGKAPVIQVPGRLFPIKVQHLPISKEEQSSKTSRINPSPYLRLLQLIDSKYPREERGDLLIFLSGYSEITAVVEALREYAQQNKRWIILPLHSSLSIAEQDKVFDYPPEGVRKCIVSTNIAETSVTIDGVRFVADSGKVKEMNYDPVSKLQRLQEFWISRASAEQRKGRAGRTGPGVCFRFYSEKDYAEFSAYAAPEIQRVPLDSMLLQMISMGLPDARKFPFIEPPSKDSIENSLHSLKEKGALTPDEKLTAIGECLAGLPVDVTIGKMLLMGSIFRQVEAVLALAAALSVQSPFTNRAYRDPDCEAARKELDSDHGDPITLLNAYRAWLELKAGSSGHHSRKWCKKRGFEEQRFYEMTKLRQQFRHILSDAGLLEDENPSSIKDSSQRAQRHGEMRYLRSLKKDILKSSQRTRRILKLGTDDEEEEDDFDEDQLNEADQSGRTDIRDVEFRMQNDASKIRFLLKGVATDSYHEVMLLKLILCSGLSPQLALADEFNNYKSTSEQLFHTRAKPFTVLHPMGVFANHPEVLQLQDFDTVEVPGMKSKHQISSKHQILAYVTLLETTKVYLCNTLRMPAAQTLLLFSQYIDTNSNFSRIVCDGWLELHFIDSGASQNLLHRACQLRCRWNELLMLRLDKTKRSKKEAQKMEDKAKILQRDLHYDLISFTQTQIPYSIKRLLASDIKQLYVGSEFGSIRDDEKIDSNPFWPEFVPVPHPTKGGLQMAEFLVYACLEDSDMSQDCVSSPWVCPHCQTHFYLTGFGRLRHQAQCVSKQQESPEGSSEIDVVPKTDSGYFCPRCQITLNLTGIELLRHKKKHEQEDDCEENTT